MFDIISALNTVACIRYVWGASKVSKILRLKDSACLNAVHALAPMFAIAPFPEKSFLLEFQGDGIFFFKKYRNRKFFCPPWSETSIFEISSNSK